MDQITDHISFYFKLLDFCKKKTLTFIHHIRVMYICYVCKRWGVLTGLWEWGGLEKTGRLASVALQTRLGSPTCWITRPQTHALPQSESQEREKEKGLIIIFKWWKNKPTSLRRWTHLIPRDGVIKRVNGLVFTRNRVIIVGIKLRIFLDDVFDLPHLNAAS